MSAGSLDAPPERRPWTARTRPVRDPELRARVGRVVAAADAALGRDPAPAPKGVEDALERLDALSDALQAAKGPRAEHLALLRELRDVHAQLRVSRALERYDAMAGIQRGLSQLRGLRSTQDLLTSAPREIGKALGFDRVIISRVEDGMWIPVKIYVREDEAWADQILAAATTEPEALDHMLLESEMVRRRAPMLVMDVQESEQVHRRIAETSDSRSYVAAPIMPEGQVIGFLHADYYVSQRHPDEIDRDTLFAFAEAFGYVFERAVLAERLTAQRDQVRALTASLEVVLEDIRDAEVRIAPAAEPASSTRPRPAPAPASAGRIAALLTAREIEVTRLLANGATNAEIALRLTISEGTVKSHVKHILRKLRAANRAEATAKFLRLASLPEHAG